MTVEVLVYWWGHATATIELGGVRFLTDPLLAGSLGHLRRIGGARPGPDAFRADAVLISHLHADHLHIASLLRLPADIAVIAPAGTRALLSRQHRALAARVDEVQPGAQRDIGGVRVDVVAAEHDGRRSPISRHHGPALGFVLGHSSQKDRVPQGVGPQDVGPQDVGHRVRSHEVDSQRVWFAGDTGLTAVMNDLAPIGLALVPVGGWGPTLGAGHLDPADAAEAARRVGARHALPIHYGTFWPVGLKRAHPANYQRMFVSPGIRFADALATVSPATVAEVLDSGDCVRVEL